MTTDQSEPVYDLAELMRSDWHVHTAFSMCADRGMTIPAIVNQAELLGLRDVALVDHHQPGEDDARLRAAVKLKAQERRLHKGGVVLHLGAEFSAHGVDVYSDTPEMNRLVEYRLYAPNHYHHPGWQHPDGETPRDYALHALAIVRATILSGRADCIAHPFVGDYLRERLDEPGEVPRSISDDELLDVLGRAAERHVSMELNAKAVMRNAEFSRRYWQLGQKAGVTFRFGSDAHRIGEIGAPALADDIRRILG